MAKLCVLIGSHGVGKTTAFEYVKSKLCRSDIEFIPDVARLCPYPVGATTTLKAQLWIFHEQLRRESGSKIAICDKSAIDHYAYIIHWFGKKPKLEHRLIEQLQHYELIIKFPPNPHFLIKDDIRPANTEFQQKIDRIIEELIDSWELQVKRIRDTRSEQIVARVYEEVHSWLSHLTYETEIEEKPKPP
ncbi:MAG: AAA family ATPase [Nitrospirae bacterium]|nr:AAA family ATPase [Nitrospirota bacterium]